MVKIVAAFRSLHLLVKFEIIFKIANKNISDVMNEINYFSHFCDFAFHSTYLQKMCQ